MTELSLNDPAFRAGMLTARLQWVGSSLIIVAEDLRAGTPVDIELAKLGLDRAIASIKATLDEVEDARRTALRQLMTTEEGE